MAKAKKFAPGEVTEMKRQLGLDKQFMASVKSYVRFEKTSQQIVGEDNTAPIVWDIRSSNLGGGGLLATNRLIVPELLGGLWRCRVVVNLDGSTVKPSANYRVEMWVNDILFEYESTQATTARQLSARFNDEVWVEAGDEVQFRLSNFTNAGTVTIDAGTYAAFQFLGSV